MSSKNLIKKAEHLPSKFVPPPDVELTEADEAGFSPEAPVINYASIGHKELLNDQSEVIANRGRFRFKDPHGGFYREKVILTGIILLGQRARVYFRSTESQSPDCKSNDGIIGKGEGDGMCSNCAFNEWNGSESKPDGSPACSEMRNLFFLEDKDSCDGKLQPVDDYWGGFILVLGRSALKPWKNYDNWLKEQQGREKKFHALHHLVKVQIDLLMINKSGQDPYWIPRFTPIEPLDSATVKTIQAERETVLKVMSGAIDSIVHNADEFNGSSTQGNPATDFSPPDPNESPLDAGNLTEAQKLNADLLNTAAQLRHEKIFTAIRLSAAWKEIDACGEDVEKLKALMADYQSQLPEIA